MGKPKAPTPPNPVDTSKASTGTAVATSLANTMLEGVNKVGPDGSLTRDQTGTYDFRDPYTGVTYNIPTFTETTKLSPSGERINNLNNATSENLGGLAKDQSAFLKSYLGKGRQLLEPDEALRKRSEDALMSRMNPQIERDRAALEQRLANQGIGAGARAYSAAQSDFGQNVNDARMSAILGAGDEQARDFSVRSAARNQPINEIMALLSGSQVNTPNFTMNSPSAIPTTDNAGIINTNYGQKQLNYQSKLNNWNNTWGGLFGAGAKAITGGVL